MRFTFGIALMPRATAGNWSLVETLLDLTLASVCAQSDPDFKVVIAGHDRPSTILADSRIEFIEVDWPVKVPGPHNDDSGRKKHALNDLVLGRGGGMLMFVDADDWVDRDVVRSARAAIGEADIGAVIESGFATDFRSLRTAPLPHPRIFGGEYFRLCGSSTVACLRPEEREPLRQDPFDVLRSHHQWAEVARRHGASLARLPVCGSYVINTSENHSENHSPYVEWRRTFAEAVNREGQDIDRIQPTRFGLSCDEIRAASERFFS